jgi:hypothetical protein
VAEDFVYALKRHATTRVTTPIFSTFAEVVVGLKAYGELIKAEDAKLRQGLPPAGLDRWPVGTGPYKLTEFVQDRRHVMVRNPRYRGEPYPCEGMPGDREAGLLDDCGKPTPFIDRMVLTIEREALPQKGQRGRQARVHRQGFSPCPRI